MSRVQARWSEAEDRRLLLACMALNTKIDTNEISRVLGNRTRQAVSQRITAFRKEAEGILNGASAGSASTGGNLPRRKAKQMPQKVIKCDNSHNSSTSTPRVKTEMKLEQGSDDLTIIPMARSWLRAPPKKLKPESEEGEGL